LNSVRGFLEGSLNFLAGRGRGFFFPVGAPGIDLRRIGKATVVIYRFGDSELDTARYELQCQGVLRPIEPQVFDLLRYLVENRDRIVTKDELYKAIWQGRIVSEAALSSGIKAARRAVNDTGNDQRIIRTLYRRGFRFVAPVEVVGTNVLGRDHDAMPSIAVLPFENLSGSSDDEYFSDGITDEITFLLARHRWLRVISRHSSFAFKGRHLDVREIGQVLGARYLLEGSVRRAGSQVRIGVQLVNGSSGAQLWSERYERELEDVFKIQDDIGKCIAGTLEPELAQAEEALARSKQPDSLTAWDCYQRGQSQLFTFTESGFAEAERLFARAIAIDPGLARAHAGQAYAYILQAFYGDPAERPVAIEAALAAARRAVTLDEHDAYSHFVLGRAHSLRRQHDEAIAELETALDLNPSLAQAYYALGFSLTCSRRPAEAVQYYERFAALSPRDPYLWANLSMRALAHFWLGEYDLAEDCARRSLRQPNVTSEPLADLAAVLGAADKQDAAREVAAILLARRPGYTCETAGDDLFFMDDPEHLQVYLEGLRRAGIPWRAADQR
jgi:TolB-like protein